MLKQYPDCDNATILSNVFLYGFRIRYMGPRTPLDCINLTSVYQHPQVELQKLQSEINIGRIMGQFRQMTISNIRCSPIGIIPKKNAEGRCLGLLHIFHIR